jgi:hypothetical protein
VKGCKTLGYGQLVALCKAQGFPDPFLAAAVAMAESRGNTCASNTNTDGSIDRGVFQINSVNGSLSVYGLKQNVANAFKISHGGRDWSPWTTFKNGAYRQFINRHAHVPKNLRPPGMAGGTGHGAQTSSGGGAIDSAAHKSAALSALVWILFVLGGAGLVLFGAARMVGLKRPREAAAPAPATTSKAPSQAQPAARSKGQRSGKMPTQTHRARPTRKEAQRRALGPAPASPYSQGVPFG